MKATLVALAAMLALTCACVEAALARSPARWRAVRVLVTSYCLTGRTATGRLTAPGVVAVDPGFIRLGSRLWIPGYGAGVAADTGSAVRGAHVDEWRASCRDAMRATRYATIRVY